MATSGASATVGDPAAAAAQASEMALAAAQTNPAALDPYGPGDETAEQALRSSFAVVIAFAVTCTVFLVLRFLSVLKLRKRRIPLAWDDWFLLLAYPFVMGTFAIMLVIYHYEVADGSLAHAPIVQPHRLTPILKCILALAEIELPAMVLTRFSVLALYLRLFTDRFVRVVTYVLIALYSLYWIGFGVAGIFQCRPVDYLWNRVNPGATGSCWDIKFSRSVSPPNIIFDFIIIVLPLPFICKLRISNLKKLGLSMIIFTGVGAFAVTVVRTALLEKTTNEFEEPSMTNNFILLMVLEPGLYFITACLPAMLPLFRLLIPHGKRHQQAPRIIPDLGTSPSSFQSAPSSNGSGNGFLRLRDDAPPAVAEVRSLSRNSKNVEAAEVYEIGNNLQLEDLRQFSAGDGIIVQTEVSVTWTTEERIEEILDMW